MLFKLLSNTNDGKFRIYTKHYVLDCYIIDFKQQDTTIPMNHILSDVLKKYSDSNYLYLSDVKVLNKYNLNELATHNELLLTISEIELITPLL